MVLISLHSQIVLLKLYHFIEMFLLPREGKRTEGGERYLVGLNP